MFANDGADDVVAALQDVDSPRGIREILLAALRHDDDHGVEENAAAVFLISRWASRTTLTEAEVGLDFEWPPAADVEPDVRQAGAAQAGWVLDVGLDELDDSGYKRHLQQEMLECLQRLLPDGVVGSAKAEPGPDTLEQTDHMPQWGNHAHDAGHPEEDDEDDETLVSLTGGPLTASQIRLITDHRPRVVVEYPGVSTRDLDWLAPVEALVTELCVLSGQYTDLTALSRFSALRRLELLTEPAVGMDLTNVPLVFYDGPWNNHVRSLARVRTLKEICAPVPPAALAEFAAVPTLLDLRGAVHYPTLDVGLDLQDLRSLELDGNDADFDLTWLLKAPRIEHLALGNCRTLTGVRHLVESSSLTWVWLEDCRDVDDEDAMAGLSGPQINAIGATPFDRAWRQKLPPVLRRNWNSDAEYPGRTW